MGQPQQGQDVVSAMASLALKEKKTVSHHQPEDSSTHPVESAKDSYFRHLPPCQQKENQRSRAVTDIPHEYGARVEPQFLRGQEQQSTASSLNSDSYIPNEYGARVGPPLLAVHEQLSHAANHGSDSYIPHEYGARVGPPLIDGGQPYLPYSSYNSLPDILPHTEMRSYALLPNTRRSGGRQNDTTASSATTSVTFSTATSTSVTYRHHHP